MRRRTAAIEALVASSAGALRRAVDRSPSYNGLLWELITILAAHSGSDGRKLLHDTLAVPAPEPDVAPAVATFLKLVEQKPEAKSEAGQESG